MPTVGLPVGAAAQTASDWPCVQRLVNRLEPGQMWSGPPLPAGGHGSSAEIEAVVRELIDLQTAPEELPAKVNAYAGTVAGDERAARLAALFGTSLDTLNRERADLIAGIRRYAARQQALAARIAERSHALDVLERTPGSDPVQVADLRQARDWDTRLHADRQRQLTLVCDQPVRLEQRAFALARTIQEQLP